MRRTSVPLSCGLAVVLATAAPAAEAPPPDLAASISRLAAAIDRLGAAMEKQAADRDDARAGQRVQVAVGILGLRMRRVERLESGVLQLENEAVELRNQLGLFTAQLTDSDEQRRLEGREMTADERALRSELEGRVAMIEGRLKGIDERASALAADLDRELRGLSSLEAILNDWLKEQR